MTNYEFFDVVADCIKQGYLVHGTDIQFDTFDPIYIRGGNRANEGYGFYFTDTAYKAVEYGTFFKVIKKSDFNFINAHSPIDIEMFKYCENENLEFLVSYAIRKDNVKTYRELEQYFENQNAISWVKCLCEFYTSMGIDGFINSNVYTVFNFDKLNQYAKSLNTSNSLLTEDKKIIINQNQLVNLKNTYKTKYVNNSELYKSPKLCNGVNQNLNKLKIIDLIEEYGELTSKYNKFFKREKPIGVCEDGSPIQLYTLDQTKTDKPIILIVGGVHGDEKTSIHGIYETVKFLLEPNKWSRFITSNFVIKIVPCLNVYGFNNNKRNNSNDKDLNRDFIKTTQKETKALTNYINKNKDRIKIILDSHNAYNEEFVSCKQEMKYFEEYEDVAFKLNLFLNGKYESDNKRSFLWVSRSQNDGTLSDFINKNKFIGHTVESPRSLVKEIHYPNPINYEDGAEVTLDLLINLMYIYGKMYNQKIMNESRRTLTEGHILKSISFTIMEEKGINDEVKSEANRLCNIIEKKLKTTPLTLDEKRDSFCKLLVFSENVLYRDMTIKIIVYYFDNENDKNRLNNIYNGKYISDTNTLEIVSSCVNDGLSPYNFYGTIQHELSHIFQSIKTERDNVMNENDYSLYQTALSMINDDDKLTKFIGKCIYASFKIEEEAYGNSLYQELIKTKQKKWGDAYKNTAMYRHINMMRSVYNVITNPNKTNKVSRVIDKYLSKHKISRNKLIMIIDRTIRNYVNRAGKIIALVQEKENLFDINFFSTNGLTENEYFDGDLI